MRWLNRPGALVMLLLCVALAGIAGPYTVRLGEVTETGQTALGPADGESARVAALLDASGGDEALPLAVVWTGEERGRRLTAAQHAAARRVAASISGSRPDAKPVLARDGMALTAVVAAGPDDLPKQLAAIRKAAGAVPGTDVHLAGPAAAQADLDDAFAHTDGTLLAVSLTGVLLILLLVYRSAVMPVLVLAAAMIALSLASAVLYALARAGRLTFDGQVQGIVFVLVIGASTDYAMLLVARYREELARPGDTPRAVAAACRATAAPVLASAATVACAMMTLTLSAMPSHQTLGPAVAIAMACCAAASLTFLPAVLLLCGHRVFRPRPGHFALSDGWERLARATVRRPRRRWLLCCVLLLVGAAFTPLLSQRGVPLHEALPESSPSAAGQAVLARHFPAGTASPLVIVTPLARTADVRAATAATPGVAAVDVVTIPHGTTASPARRVLVRATLASAPDSEEARRVVERLRVSLGGTGALVGGQAAHMHDMHRAALRDQYLVLPVVLLVVLVILIALLRCLLLPLLLVVAAGVSLLTAFGVSALAFHLTGGTAATEPAVVLFSFIFLVALGVDYNIFLVHRVRNEALTAGTALGVRRGLVSTGGVISAAGVILAATFAALTVMPLLYLAQIGCIVAVGVLIDALLVRLFLVPALILDLGHRAWWPAVPPKGPVPPTGLPGLRGEAADERAAQLAPVREN
ncbi:MMPL family transporter [Streptomyces sp. NPDC006339]|uniref:MMPL family transporter n=1 Tax=Streptomyces sp. NPDC006339 TaxID=3156755 RepID=UPI0033B14CAA